MKRKHTLAPFLASAMALALVSALQPVQASLMPLYQESVSGDLDGTQTLTLSTSGTVSGAISAGMAAGNWAGSDGDHLLLSIAAGKRLTGISVAYQADATVGYARLNVVFDALIQGELFFDDLNNLVGSGQSVLFASGFGNLYSLPLTQADLGGAGEVLEFGIGMGYPTDAGGTIPSADMGLVYGYTLSFTVEDVPAVTVPATVPEPAGSALWLSGLSACWLATRRRPGVRLTQQVAA